MRYPTPRTAHFTYTGVVDPRVCLAAFHQDDPAMVLANYMFVCETCKRSASPIPLVLLVIAAAPNTPFTQRDRSLITAQRVSDCG